MRPLFIFGDIGDNFNVTSLPFIQAASGTNESRICVLGIGGPSWDTHFQRVFYERWIRLGVKNVIPLTLDVNSEPSIDVYEELSNCTGLLICGGDTREYYKTCVCNSEMKNKINSLYRNGIPIAGVSAGALISSSPCTVWGSKVTLQNNEFIVRSVYDNTVPEQELITGNGLGLLTGCLIEPHFSEYGGFPRLLAAMQKTSSQQGIGCDEPICLEIKNELHVKVYGRGRTYFIKKDTIMNNHTVRVVEPGQEFYLSKTLRGKVVSGQGNFSYWINKLSGYYKAKTGMTLYPGTLNIMLDEPYDLPTDVIRLEKEEYGGSVSISIQECVFLGRKAFILRTDGNASGNGDHPKTIIELATDIRLRDYYSLIDGDIVEVNLN
ncbi:DUF120 domain-containing protein [Paenibacillus xerothermodurans]|uniref:DUF120 domain-containing protein n=1 Tax=Paenibacillus xerothermodurans TaxID=1977292 RepID=A0A2W1NHJ8_PAEXE|nr:DUF120 domain-containing protein [Paenibacillus xerothermodurans]PZE19005.1 DUF120 domain-containing protein [Paenibacillus xerothermodurans]